MKSLFFYFEDEDEDPALILAMRDMLSGSDRAVAIQGAALVDAQLAAAIRRKFMGKSHVEKALGGREFLSTFSARITLCHMLGMFSDELAGDLALIRKIRNDFAHDPLTVTFDTQSVASRCQNLTVPDHNIIGMEEPTPSERSYLRIDTEDLDRNSARFRYIATCAFFTMIAAAAARHAKPADFKVANG